MNEDVYYKLAKVLDTLPCGFPSTEDGLEIRLLKKLFTIFGFCMSAFNLFFIFSHGRLYMFLMCL